MEWRGSIPETEGKILTKIEEDLSDCEPETEGQEILSGETYTSFNWLADLRGRRFQSVHEGLAGPLWTVVFAGAFLSIGLTWFFDMKSQGPKQSVGYQSRSCSALLRATVKVNFSSGEASSSRSFSQAICFCLTSAKRAVGRAKRISW